MRHSILALVVLLATLAPISPWPPAGAAAEQTEWRRITESPYPKWPLAISRNAVAWIERHDDVQEVHVYNVDTAHEQTITSSSSQKSSVATDGDLVVWTDDRGGAPTPFGPASNIWGFDLRTEREFETAASATDHRNPTVSGSLVAWEESFGNSYGNFIGGVDLADGATFSWLPSGLAMPSNLGMPKLVGRSIIAVTGSSGAKTWDYDVVAYSIDSGKVRFIGPAMRGYSQYVLLHLAVSGDLVAWRTSVQGQDGEWDEGIVVYDASTARLVPSESPDSLPVFPGIGRYLQPATQLAAIPTARHFLVGPARPEPEFVANGLVSPQADGLTYYDLNSGRQEHIYPADFSDRYSIQLAASGTRMALIRCRIYGDRGGPPCPDTWDVLLGNLAAPSAS